MDFLALKDINWISSTNCKLIILHFLFCCFNFNSYNEEEAKWMARRSDSLELVAYTLSAYIAGTKEWLVHNDSKVKLYICNICFL